MHLQQNCVIIILQALNIEENLMYHTVSELAKHIKTLIDAHWRLEKSEEDLTKDIREIFEDPMNCGLALRGMAFSATFEQRLGKKRAQFLKQLLNKIDPNKYHFV